MHHFIVKTDKGVEVLKMAGDCNPANMLKDLREKHGDENVSWEFLPVDVDFTN